MEKINCPLCESKSYEHIYSCSDALTQIDDISFSIVKCLNCNFYYLNPRPDINEIKKYYPEKYYGEQIEKEQLLKKDFKILRRKYSKIKKYEPKRLLDIGAQRGDFLEYSRRQNSSLEVFGTDLDETISNLFNIKYKYGYAWEVDYPAKHFDVITMWEVFEHIHKPGELLEKIHTWLSDSGILILSLPNFNSINKRWMRAEDLPRHLFMFTPNSITKLLEKNKFEVFRKDFVRSIFPNTSKELFVFWFKRIIQKKTWDEILIEYTTPEKESRSFFLFLVRIYDRIITIPLQFILNYFGYSSNMVIFAKKVKGR
ncbi:class I SAM-dependent methyltransferase [Candidatus Dependentiae bacterium]|nr:class I SAM-dependent methyltransferase [Candidatus Dependentiae bacterium]